MSDNYLDWETLEHGFGSDQSESPTLKEVHSKSVKQRELTDLLSIPEVPEELKALVRERIQLENKVKSLTSANSLNQSKNERENKRFYVPVHTKQSRIKERTRNKEDEIRQQAIKKKLEKSNIEKWRSQQREANNKKALLDRVSKRKLNEKQNERRQRIVKETKLKQLNKLKKQAEIESERQAKIQAFAQKRIMDRKAEFIQSLKANEVKRMQNIGKLIEKRQESHVHETRSYKRKEINRKKSQETVLQKKVDQKLFECSLEARRARAIAKRKEAMEEERKWLENRERLIARKKSKEQY